jgi:hypothetical protein
LVWRAAAATATAAKKPAKKGAACDPMVMEAIRCLDLLVRVASLQQLAAVLSEVLPRAEGEGEEPDDDDPMLTLQPQVSRSCGQGSCKRRENGGPGPKLGIVQWTRRQ